MAKPKAPSTTILQKHGGDGGGVPLLAIHISGGDGGTPLINFEGCNRFNESTELNAIMQFTGDSSAPLQVSSKQGGQLNRELQFDLPGKGGQYFVSSEYQLFVFDINGKQVRDCATTTARIHAVFFPDRVRSVSDNPGFAIHPNSIRKGTYSLVCVVRNLAALLSFEVV